MKAILRDEEYGKKFTLFVVSMFIFHFGMSTAAPIWPIYHVRDLGLSTTVIGLFNVASGSLAVVGFWYLGKVAAKRGDEFVVCPAWALSLGCKSRMGVGDTNH